MIAVLGEMDADRVICRDGRGSLSVLKATRAHPSSQLQSLNPGDRSVSATCPVGDVHQAQNNWGVWDGMWQNMDQGTK